MSMLYFGPPMKCHDGCRLNSPHNLGGPNVHGVTEEGLHLVLSPSVAQHCKAKDVTMRSGTGMLSNTLADIQKPIQLGSTTINVRLMIMGYVGHVDHKFEKGETITKEKIDKNPKIISEMSLLMSNLICDKERSMSDTNVWILLGGKLFLLCQHLPLGLTQQKQLPVEVNWQVYLSDCKSTEVS
jgi:hypothetical protein